MAKTPAERQAALRIRRSRARVGAGVAEHDRSEGRAAPRYLDTHQRMASPGRHRQPARTEPAGHALDRFLEADAAEDEAAVTR